MPSKKMFTKEEHELLAKTSKTEGSGTSASSPLFSIFGFVTAGIPIYIYHFILHADLESHFIIYGIVSIVSGLILSAAHGNSARKMRPTIVDEIEQRMKQKLSSKKLAPEKVKDLIQNNAAKQAAYTAIFQNNAIFLLSVVASVFYFCSNFSITLSYLLSVAGSAGFTYLLTTGNGKSQWGEKKE